MGGASHCSGTLEMIRKGDQEYKGRWRPLYGRFDWSQKTSSVVCRELDCGSAVSTYRRSSSKSESELEYRSPCHGSEPSLRKCGSKIHVIYSDVKLELICSGNANNYYSLSLLSS